MRPWRESPPDAFVIDLSRLPSQGREIAIALRQSSSPAARPHCLLRGSGREGCSQIKAQLPDAVYCRTGALCSALKQADCKPAQRASETDRHDGQICFKNCRSETRDQGMIHCSTDPSSAKLRKGAWRNAFTRRILGTQRTACGGNALLRARSSFPTAQPFGSSSACRLDEIVDFVAKEEGVRSRRRSHGTSNSRARH